MEVKRRLTKVEANFISLVGKGANNKIIIFKAEPEGGELQYQKQVEIKKIDDEQKMVYGIVYSPDEVDLQGDIASADVIKNMAFSFMKNARTNNVDKQHNFISDEGFVAESWLTKNGDPVFPEEKAGSWAVGIKVEKEETWQLVKSGAITGLSLAGLAIVEDVSGMDVIKQQLFSLLGKLKKYFTLNKTSESSNHQISKNLEKLKSVLNEIQNLVYRPELQHPGNTMNDIEKINNAGLFGGNGAADMTREEFNNAVKESIKPVNEKLEELEKENKELALRIEAIEKSTPGSRQAVKKDRGSENQIPIWT
jgi:hypothetical protein